MPKLAHKDTSISEEICLLHDTRAIYRFLIAFSLPFHNYLFYRISCCGNVPLTLRDMIRPVYDQYIVP